MKKIILVLAVLFVGLGFAQEPVYRLESKGPGRVLAITDTVNNIPKRYPDINIFADINAVGNVEIFLVEKPKVYVPIQFNGQRGIPYTQFIDGDNADATFANADAVTLWFDVNFNTAGGAASSTVKYKAADYTELSALSSPSTGDVAIVTGDGIAGTFVYEENASIKVERIVNGDFTTDTNWTKGTGWTISGGLATHATGNAVSLSQNIGVTTYNKTFEIKFSISNSTTGYVTVSLGGYTTSSWINGNGDKTVIQTVTNPSSNTSFYIGVPSGGTFDGSIDNISVKEVITNNNGTIINGWVRDSGNDIKLQWFQPSADGVTDDTSIINSALQLGGNIQSERGKTYLITSLIAPIDYTNLNFTGSTFIRKSSTISHMITLKGSHINLNGGTWIGNSSNQSGEVYNHSGINSTGDYNIIEKTIVDDIYGIGIRVSNCDFNEIKHNTVIEPTIQGIYAEVGSTNDMVGVNIHDNHVYVRESEDSQGIMVASGTNTFWITDFFIQDNSVYGYPNADTGSANVLITPRGKRGKITGNNTFGGRMGISNDFNEDGIVSENVCRDFSQIGIELVGSATYGGINNIIVTSNNILSTITGSIGIQASGQPLNSVTISNNTIDTPYRSIDFQSSANCEGLTLQNNTLKNASNFVINLEKVTKSIISNNVIKANISGTTSIIKIVGSNELNITGNKAYGTFTNGIALYNGSALELINTIIINNDFGTITAPTNDGGYTYGTSYYYVATP